MSYVKTKYTGVFRHTKSGKFLARITLEGEQHKATFDNEYYAVSWRLALEKGERPPELPGATTTLRSVWSLMKEEHFPSLEFSTKEIWERRYQLVEKLQDLPMADITSEVITEWVRENVTYFKSSAYLNGPRGKAKRCNLDNELNLFVTIFNWYRKSKHFKVEANNLSNPVEKHHYKQGFIRAKPIKDKSITLEAALQFFSCLKPLYRDLALMQYFTASRIGEVAGLQWSRLDLENRRGHIMETCVWDNTHKVFVKLKEYPKNREARPIFITDEMIEILKRRAAFRKDDCGYVFHVDGKPLNYCTIQVNYREAQRISGVPYRGTHILRHGMAKLARQVGGLDAVIAVTGHKDFKLADHYSSLDQEFRKEVALKIQEKIRSARLGEDHSNVISLGKTASAH